MAKRLRKSMTIYLESLATETRIVTNPFTGSRENGEIRSGLTAAERESVLSILANYNANGPDKGGLFEISWDDGSSVTVYSHGLDDSAKCISLRIDAMPCHKLTPHVAQLIHDLAYHGNMMLIPEEGVHVVVSKTQVKKAQAHFGRIEGVVESASALQTILNDGFSSLKVGATQPAGWTPTRPE